MANPKGFFDLTTSGALRHKLHRDFDRFRDSPIDQDAAFNFFVTALSMVDWVYGSNPTAKAVVQANPIIKVCSHIANGAKHFELDDRRHKSVTKTELSDGAFDPAIFDGAIFDVPRLIIHLDSEVSAQLGSSIEAITLAQKLVEFWDRCSDVS